MCVSNSCLFFAIVKKKSNLNQNLQSYLPAWIVLEMTCANYPTPKPLVKGKDSQTVGHAPRMVSKHLASKQRANAAHKLNIASCVSISAAVKTRAWEWLH